MPVRIPFGIDGWSRDPRTLTSPAGLFERFCPAPDQRTDTPRWILVLAIAVAAEWPG